jgi:hypothetical protein
MRDAVEATSAKLVFSVLSRRENDKNEKSEIVKKKSKRKQNPVRVVEHEMEK